MGLNYVRMTTNACGSIGDGGDLLDTFKGEVFPAKTVPYFGYAVNNYAEVISDVITAFKNYIEIIKGVFDNA